MAKHEEYELLQIIPAQPGTRALLLFNEPDGGELWEEQPILCWALCKVDLTYNSEKGPTFTKQICGMVNGEYQLDPLEMDCGSSLLGYLAPGEDRDLFIKMTCGVHAKIDAIRDKKKAIP